MLKLDSRYDRGPTRGGDFRAPLLIRVEPTASNMHFTKQVDPEGSSDKRGNQVSLLSKAAQYLYSLGFRKQIAGIASLSYGLRARRQSFGVDQGHRWLNRQPEATIVSPVVHTTSYAAYRRWVL